MRTVIWIISGLLVLVFTPSLDPHSINAQETATSLDVAIAKAKSELQPITSEEVAESRQALHDALANLDRVLGLNGGENREGWHLYLRTPELKTQIEAPSPDLALLNDILGSMRRKHPGLELPSFVRVREKLKDFIDTSFFSGQADQVALYSQLLDRVAQAYPAAVAEPTPTNLSVLGRLLDRLESAGQASDVVSLVRQRFSSPNVIARVSSSFISRNTERPVDDTRPVSEDILGTQQTGTAHTTGIVRLRPVPNHSQAELLVELIGTNTSQTVGRRPVGRRNQVVINSHSTSSVHAMKRLLIADGGIVPYPATATACTHSTICSVCAPPLISGIATKQVYKNKSQAEQIAAGRLASRTETQLDQRVAESLVNANNNLRNELHVPLVRLDAHPQDIGFSSTSNDLDVRVVQANSEQLAAPSAPPALDVQGDASVVVHQSAINNLAEAVFGGKTVSDRQVAEWVELSSGNLPPEFRISNDDRWSIQFSSYQPITVEFGDSRLTVKLRGSRFTRNSEEVNDTIEIGASYLIERTATGVKLTRDGEVTVTFPGRDQLTVQQTAVKTFMHDKFSALFAESAETQGIRFPGRFAEKAPMHLSTFMMTEGWLSLSWIQEQ